MNQQALEAAMKAYNDLWPFPEKTLADCMTAALTAYAEACGDRVEWTNNEPFAETVRVGDWSTSFPRSSHACDLQPGEELVVRKAVR